MYVVPRINKCLLPAGMLSKSKGQTLRVAATLHVLFHMETPLDVPDVISTAAIEAAQNIMDVCIQHAAFLAGRGDVEDTIQEIIKGCLHKCTQQY